MRKATATPLQVNGADEPPYASECFRRGLLLTSLVGSVAGALLLAPIASLVVPNLWCDIAAGALTGAVVVGGLWFAYKAARLGLDKRSA